MKWEFRRKEGRNLKLTGLTHGVGATGIRLAQVDTFLSLARLFRGTVLIGATPTHAHTSQANVI